MTVPFVLASLCGFVGEFESTCCSYQLLEGAELVGFAFAEGLVVPRQHGALWVVPLDKGAEAEGDVEW